MVRSRDPALPEGALVRHGAGFQDRFLGDSRSLAILTLDPKLPLSVYLHALGGTGLTAYGGLLRTGALAPGEQVLVSTAGGAVGSVAAQIARGCHVVGLTGADAKARWLESEARITAINYHSDGLGEALDRAADELERKNSSPSN